MPGQRIFPVVRRCLGVECYLCRMKPTQLLRAILPDVLIDNFEVDHFEKTDTRFDIWLDEKKAPLCEGGRNTLIGRCGIINSTPYDVETVRPTLADCD